MNLYSHYSISFCQQALTLVLKHDRLITTTTAKDTMETTEKVRTLSLHDRCDRCIAQAWVKATKGELDLLFCGHHYHVNQLEIDYWADTVLDERSLIPV